MRYASAKPHPSTASASWIDRGSGHLTILPIPNASLTGIISSQITRARSLLQVPTTATKSPRMGSHTPNTLPIGGPDRRRFYKTCQRGKPIGAVRLRSRLGRADRRLCVRAEQRVEQPMLPHPVATVVHRIVMRPWPVLPQGGQVTPVRVDPPSRVPQPGRERDVRRGEQTREPLGSRQPGNKVSRTPNLSTRLASWHETDRGRR